MGAELAKGPGRLGQVLALGYVSLLAFTLVLAVAAVVAGFYAFFFTSLSPSYDLATPASLFFWLGPYLVVLPIRVSIGAFFAGVAAVILGLALYATNQRTRPIAAMVESASSGVERLFRSPLLVAVISLGFLAFGADVIDRFASGTTSFPDPMAELLSLSVAPLVEEFGFRLVLIGAIMAMLSLDKGWRRALVVLWRPSVAYEGGPGREGLKPLAALLIGFSALTFGITHVLAGWTAGKLFEATFGGLVLGYVYVKYGFHVSVLTHWGFDFVGNAFSFYGQGVAGIPWNSATSEYPLQTLMDYDLVYVFGLASFLVVAFVGAHAVAKYFGSDEAKASEVHKGLGGEPVVAQ